MSDAIKDDLTSLEATLQAHVAEMDAAIDDLVRERNNLWGAVPPPYRPAGMAISDSIHILTRERTRTAALLHNIHEHAKETQQLDGVRKKSRYGQSEVNYLIALAVVVTFVGGLVYEGFVQTPGVEITFNVGEIIGGSLGGIGVLAAGLAYAVTTLNGGPRSVGFPPTPPAPRKPDEPPRTEGEIAF